MTNYKLEEFKNWLNAVPSRKKNLPLRDDYLRLISGENGIIDSFAQYCDLCNGGGEVENAEIQVKYRDVLKEWIDKIKEEEYREFNGLTKKTIKNWLQKSPDRTNGLPHWNEFLYFLPEEENVENLNYNLVINVVWGWQKEWGELNEYKAIFFQYLEEYTSRFFQWELNKLFITITGKKQEFTQLNQMLATSDKNLENSNETLQNLHQQLDQLKKQKDKQIKDLTDQLEKQKQLTTKNQNLETQLTTLNQIIFSTNNFDFTALKSELHRLKLQDLAPQLKTKKTQLEQLITNLRQKVGVNLEKVLELYLETYTSVVKQKSEGNNFAQNQILIFEKVLVEKLTKDDLQSFTKCQKEVLELEEQLKDFALQEDKYQNQIQLVDKKTL